MADQITCLTSDISCWEYRGEGNASLVVANPQNHKILKLTKCPAKSRDEKNSAGTNHDDDIKQQVKYAEIIMKPLLGSFICVPELVSVSQEFLQSIHNRLNKFRPPARLHKIIDAQSGFALLLPDLSFLHPFNNQSEDTVFCIEIKPKISFIPTSPWISLEREVKKRVCRYCMQQKYKVKNGSWSSASKYCPIDLFSGNSERMKFALHQLLENPQNNLKIFKNGKPLYLAPDKNNPSVNDKQNFYQNLKDFFGEAGLSEEFNGNTLESAVVQSFLDVIIDILLDTREDVPSIEHSIPINNGSQLCEASCYDVGKISNKRGSQLLELPHGCVLDVIRQVQMLDDMDIEGIFPLHKKIMHAIEKGDISSENYQLDWPFNDKELNLGQLCKNHNASPLIMPDDLDNISMDTMAHKIREFLVAGTAKDCSILLAIQPAGKTQNRSLVYPHICYHGNRTYLYSCYIIDVDAKPASRIPKYNKLDQEIVDNYT